MTKANTPLQPEDMNRFAGQMVSAESAMFDLLPDDSTIVVGGNRRKAETNEVVTCYVCKTDVFLHFKDRPELKDEKVLVFMCPDCYFKMEPQEVDKP